MRNKRISADGPLDQATVERVARAADAVKALTSPAEAAQQLAAAVNAAALVAREVRPTANVAGVVAPAASVVAPAAREASVVRPVADEASVATVRQTLKRNAANEATPRTWPRTQLPVWVPRRRYQALVSVMTLVSFL